MILTLSWKELREHQGIWLTMVVMTVALGSGLVRLVSDGDSAVTEASAALTILGMAAAYGVVCGSMMLAGEHENGTMVFLDIFWGGRATLWLGKLLVGIVLVAAQGLAVGLILWMLKHEPPHWVVGLVGQSTGFGEAPRRHLVGAHVWLFTLPVVALEAFAWGLLGSSLTRRVLAGAAVAAVGVTPIWLLAILAPPYIFFPLRLIGMAILLAFSYSNFLRQSRDGGGGSISPETPAAEPDARERFIERFDSDDAFERRRSRRRARLAEYDNEPVRVPAAERVAANDSVEGRSFGPEVAVNSSEPPEAQSVNEVLWWLTVEQSRMFLWILAAAIIGGLSIGFLIPFSAHGLWPLGSLLLGVVCGVAAFAPEQRDLSCQFLSAQHFPLKAIWRFKVVYWLAVVLLAVPVIVIGHSFNVNLRKPLGEAFDFTAGFRGPLREVMGSVLYFGVWPIYGFCAGQIVVWYCRKNILAVLIAVLTAAAAIAMWLPSIACGGMSRWPLAAPPLVMLLAGWCLVRAWASGRIHERKPIAAVVGFGCLVVVWGLIAFGHRAVEVPDVGAPLDAAAFRAGIPLGDNNPAGKAFNAAFVQFNEPNEAWLKPLEEAARLPVGVIEIPRGDDQPPLMTHLATCSRITDNLLNEAAWREPDIAIERLALVFALSRNLRSKAPLHSYLTGVGIEERALDALDGWLTKKKPDAQLLQRAFDVLNRHVAETPPPLDCLQTECFHSAGVLANPNVWTFEVGNHGNRIAERWATNGIALSLEAPWEAERKARLWRLVWAGLFRQIETPYWQFPATTDASIATNDVTRRIVGGWLPAATGPEAGLSREHVAQWLDSSWLADDRLFCSVPQLRAAAMRAQWRVESVRQGIALNLYRMETGKPAHALQDLVPKFFPTVLPTDPYSGQSFRYRIATDNDRQLLAGFDAAVGDGILWSVGPDRIDHGGQKNASLLRDDDVRWSNGEFDLIAVTPPWQR